MGSEKNENPNSNNPIINNNQNVVDHDENDAYNAQDDGDDGGGRGISFVDDMKLTTNNTPNNIDGIDNNNNKNNECIQVAVRVRPFLQLEKNEGAYKCIETFDDREEQYSYYYEDDEEGEKDSSSDDEKHPHKFRRRRRNNKQNNKEAPPQTIQIGGSTGEYYNYGDSSGLGKTYKFDHVFSERISQKKLYRRCIQNLVDSCLDGYNATCFAYGQTGSGKTYTILGPAHHLHNNTTNGDGSSSGSGISEVAVDHSSEDGIIPRAVHDLFQQLLYRKESEGGSSASACPSVKYEYEVKIQFLEIYGEQIRDLLSSSSSSSSSLIKIRDISSSTIHNNSSTTNNSASNSVIIDEPEVVGASELTVRDAKDALLYLHKGTLRRVTGATQMNAESSRSHAIFTLIIQQTTNTIQQQQEQKHSRPKESTATDAATTKTKSVLRSKFHFVDLAGSERQKRTKAEGKRFKEGVQINQGLLVLGNVISALASLSSSDNNNSTTGSNVHVPYRDSKLTRLLRGSLGGNHKTLMIACVSPASTNFEESLNCLRYANRAKNIKNKAVVNIDPTSKLIAALKNKTKLFAGEILRIRELCSDAIITTSTKSTDEEEEKQDITKNNNTALTTTLIHQILNGGEGSKDITNESLISILSDGKQAIAGTSTSTPFSSPQKSSKHNNYNNKSSTRTDTSHDVVNSPSIHTPAPSSSLVSSPFSPSLIQHNKQKEVVEEEKIQLELDLKEAQHEIERLKSSFRQTKLDLINTKEMVFHLEAEKEYYRLQVPHESQDIQLSSTTEENNNVSTGSANCCDEMTNTLTSPSSSNKQSPDKKKFDEMDVKENDSTDDNTPSPHPPPIDQRQDSEEGTSSKDMMQIHKRDFLQKVSSYEKQIANLRHELIVMKQTQQQKKEVSSAGSKSTTTRKRKPPLFNSPSKPAGAGAGALSDGEESVENRQIQELTQKYLSRPSSSTTVIKLSSSSDAAAVGTGVSEEQEGVEIEVQHTDMFDDDSSIHEITEATREAEKELDHFLPPAESPLAKKIMEKEDRFTKHKTNLDMHISELASGISAKEELMEQLNASQGKYVTMKEFYQQKLDQMDKLVKSVEEERALMEDELNKVKQNINPTSASPHSNNKNTNTIKNKSASSSKAAADLLSKKVQDLQKSLDEKDKRISHLRRQSQDLSRLTKVSHRNSTNLQRLQSEISDMKKQKVDLQRQVMNERKQHSQEIRILKKNHIMKERQLEKWKHQADLKHQRELQSAKRQASLARTAELMKLRQKYKEAEQKLRKRVVKRGALLKAGVDPALVGYYAKSENTSGSSSNSSNKNVHTYNHHSSLKGGKKSLVISGRRELNVDKMRSFLSTKVTMVGKLENIAEKVANEWEEHLQLTNRKEELLSSHNNNNNADNEQQQGQDCRESNNIIEEEMEGIDMQIKFKEQRIRQLTSKLSKRPFQSTPPSNSSGTSSSSTSSSTSDGLIDLSFFDDKEFQQISHGISHLQAAQTTCKVLFGMIVRERRKVANLAKTACLLDVKHSDIEKLLQAKTNAFRTHMEDEQVEKNLRENKHREELLEMTTQMREKDKEIELRDAMISDLEILYGPAGPLKLMDHTVDHSNYSTTNKDGDDGTGGTGSSSSSSSFFPKTSPGNTNTNNNNTKMIRRNSSHGYDELELEVKKKEVYRKKEAKVRKMLEDKEQLCRNLEAELAQVKSANKLLLSENRMQELEHANYDDDDDDEEEENDENVDDESRQQQESGDEENSQFSSNTTQRQVEHNNMITKGGGDKRSKNNNNRKRVTSRRRRKISKKKRRERHKHIIDMIIESSDDDELFGSFVEQHNTGEQDSHDSTSSSMTRGGGGGDPSWANDIMKDLSLIAEGVVPPSLRRLQGGGISFMDNPTKKALSELSRARQVRRSSSSPMNNNNNHNISSNNSVGSSTSSSHHRDSTGAGYQGSTISSSLQQNNQHQRHSTDSYFTSSNDHHHTSSSSSSSKNNEDVFDRLTNPNNYTGVQKKTFSTLPL